MTILTFNAALLEIRLLGRTFFRPIEHIERRFRRIPEHLLAIDADILCLQEVYRTDHKLRLIEQLQSRYPHVAYDTKFYTVGYDSGLMVFAKQPIKSIGIHHFKNQPTEERLFSKKIALGITLDLDRQTIGIVNCHATSIGFNLKQDDQRIERIRNEQIREVLEFSAEMKQRHQCVHVFIVGDYNCGPQISQENYRLFDDYSYVDLHNGNPDDLTWDPSCNALIQGATVYHDTPGQRVDLIMAESGIDKDYSYIETKIVLQENVVSIPNEMQVPLSDHYGVLAILERRQIE